MEFELHTLEILKESKELPKLDIDTDYFVLHISIDNADTGHSAMALQAVSKYIEHVRTTQGERAADQAWKRVQTGYILSEHVGTHEERRLVELSELEAEVLRIFKAQTTIAHKIHRNGRLRFGCRPLTDWLQPDLWENKDHQRDFLPALSDSRPWICQGDSETSRSIRILK